MSQSTNHILMIRPVKFGFNPETASDNSFQKISEEDVQQIHEKALQEFDTLVQKLTDAGVNVLVIADTLDPITPDSIFPNNWISFHKQGSQICLYPMMAQNRRHERKAHVLQKIEDKFHVKAIIDYTRSEKDGNYLEGTGSMVLDHANKIAYACISLRTDKALFDQFCANMGYKPLSFTALDENRRPIYHTNCILCVADKYAIICTDSICDENEKETVLESLKSCDKIVISISLKQMISFAGNMLQVKITDEKRILVMSSQAFRSLSVEQIILIEQFDEILHSDISTIETNGGGSARCMMAEIFLDEKLRKD